MRAKALGAVALVAALLALGAHESGALDRPERDSVDARYDVRGPHKPDPGIVIVALDTKTLAELNEPPQIARSHYAILLDALRAAGSRVIAMDVRFGGAKTPRRNDEALAAAITRNQPVLVATKDTPDGGWVRLVAGRRVPGAQLASLGVPEDSDGVIRKIHYAPVRLKTFAVRAAELLRGEPVDESHFPENEAWVDLHGPPGSYTTHSLVDVNKGRVPDSAFRDKVVLVGVTDPSGEDILTTSASSTPMPGVEIQANALETILDDFPLTESGGLVDLLFILGLAAVPAVAAIRLPALWVLAAGLGGGFAFLVAAQLLYNAGLIVPVVAPVLALSLATAGAIAVDLLSERREREALEATIGGLPKAPSEFFISYRRDQSSWPARILKTELATRFGDSSVFMDLDSIGAGQEWTRRIEDAIRACGVVLVLIGPYWLEAKDTIGRRRVDDPEDWVRREIETALAQPDSVVVPVLLDGAAMPAEEALPESLRPLARRNAVALTPDGWGAEVDELVESIRAGRIQEHLSSGREHDRD